MDAKWNRPLTSHGLESLPERTPRDFCEHEVHPCTFCGKWLHIGHEYSGSDVVLHEIPSCPEFKLCDDMRQFALLSILKARSDAGQLERN